MDINTTDQVVDGIIEGDDEQSTNNPEETKKEEPMTLEDVTSLVKGLQKGYTVNAQEIAAIRDSLQPIVDQVNKQTGAQSGDDEYMTVGKFKQILQEQNQERVAIEQKSEAYVTDFLARLKAEGVIKTPEEEQEFIHYAVDKHEMDLSKAAERWQEIKQVRAEARKELTTKKAQQEEGSKIGTSSKTSTEEQGGVDYRKVKKMDFGDF